MGLKARLKNIYAVYLAYYKLRFEIPGKLLGGKWDELETKRKFRKVFGRDVDLNDPVTLNEKIQWLKLYVREPFHTTCADKLAARTVWKKYGKEGLVPLLYQTDDWRNITYDVIPDVPCIVKCNTGSGEYLIIRDKTGIDVEKLRRDCRKWMAGNYYYRSQEWQYKDIKPCIIIEKLLLDARGHIPNDYKLHYINGELQFVYCSIDREGKNYRSIYSPSWERMNMEWVAPKDHKGVFGEDIPCPATFPRMVEIAADIARNFHYVRVDFYDVDGKLYYGEITLHHGSGYDTFFPEVYDNYYGNMLKLPDKR